MVLVTASAASAGELEELLERSQEAAYSAEQIISCNTPDGLRDAVIRIAQEDGAIWFASTVTGDVEVAAGAGGWTLLRSGGVVASASVESGDEHAGSPLFGLADLGDAEFLGRSAMAYQLVRDGVLRAELVFDDETGALVKATTFLEDGTTYCQRRFVSFDPSAPGLEAVDPASSEELQESVATATDLPESVEGFERLDVYVDDDGSTFAYYSDGFFSFAVFETRTTVRLPDAVAVEIGESVYHRSFTAGQATYVWETLSGGMALVGDLPPDLNDSVLAALPPSEEPGLFRRLWRSLFG